MAKYVDGFVLPVPKKSIDAYREMESRYGVKTAERKPQPA